MTRSRPQRRARKAKRYARRHRHGRVTRYSGARVFFCGVEMTGVKRVTITQRLTTLGKTRSCSIDYSWTAPVSAEALAELARGEGIDPEGEGRV